MNIKLIDFGLSNVFNPSSTLKTFCGSPTYASPELVQRHEYTGPEVDCWSLGVLLYVFVCGELPFDGSTFMELYKKIINAQYTVPDFVSPLCRDLISKMLVPDPHKRANIDQIISHPWVVKGGYKQPVQIGVGLGLGLGVGGAFSSSPRPINPTIVKEMVEHMGYDRKTITASILNGRYDDCAATYYLLYANMEESQRKKKAAHLALQHQHGIQQIYQSSTPSSSSSHSPSPSPSSPSQSPQHNQTQIQNQIQIPTQNVNSNTQNVQKSSPPQQQQQQPTIPQPIKAPQLSIIQRQPSITTTSTTTPTTSPTSLSTTTPSPSIPSQPSQHSQNHTILTIKQSQQSSQTNIKHKKSGNLTINPPNSPIPSNPRDKSPTTNDKSPSLRDKSQKKVPPPSKTLTTTTTSSESSESESSESSEYSSSSSSVVSSSTSSTTTTSASRSRSTTTPSSAHVASAATPSPLSASPGGSGCIRAESPVCSDPMVVRAKTLKEKSDVLTLRETRITKPMDEIDNGKVRYWTMKVTKEDKSAAHRHHSSSRKSLKSSDATPSNTNIDAGDRGVIDALHEGKCDGSAAVTPVDGGKGSKHHRHHKGSSSSHHHHHRRHSSKHDTTLTASASKHQIDGDSHKKSHHHHRHKHGSSSSSKSRSKSKSKHKKVVSSKREDESIDICDADATDDADASKRCQSSHKRNKSKAKYQRLKMDDDDDDEDDNDGDDSGLFKKDKKKDKAKKDKKYKRYSKRRSKKYKDGADEGNGDGSDDDNDGDAVVDKGASDSNGSGYGSGANYDSDDDNSDDDDLISTKMKINDGSSIHLPLTTTKEPEEILNAIKKALNSRKPPISYSHISEYFIECSAEDKNVRFEIEICKTTAPVKESGKKKKTPGTLYGIRCHKICGYSWDFKSVYDCIFKNSSLKHIIKK